MIEPSITSDQVLECLEAEGSVATTDEITEAFVPQEFCDHCSQITNRREYYHSRSVVKGHLESMCRDGVVEQVSPSRWRVVSPE